MALSPEKLAALRAKAAASKLANIDPLPAKAITTTTEAVKDEATTDLPAVLAPVPELPVATISASDLACSAPNTVDLTPQQYVVVEKIEMIKKLLLQQNLFL